MRFLLNWSSVTAASKQRIAGRPPHPHRVRPTRGRRLSASHTTLPGVGRPVYEQGQSLQADVLVTPLDHELGPFWATAGEVSHRGMFIRTRCLPREDTLLMIELVFPELPVPKLRLDAHVVHRIPGAGFGCRFIAVPDRVARRLSELVAHTSSAPRERRGSALEKELAAPLSTGPA